MLREHFVSHPASGRPDLLMSGVVMVSVSSDSRGISLAQLLERVESLHEPCSLMWPSLTMRQR